MRIADFPDTAGFILCDLEKRTMTRLTAAGLLQGWWDENHILLKDQADNFVLCNAATGKTSTLWTSAQVAGFFREQNIPGNPASAHCFSIWGTSASMARTRRASSLPSTRRR